MAKVIVDDTNLKNTADAIREKLGTEDTLKISEFADKVREVYNTALSDILNSNSWAYMFAKNARENVYNAMDYNSTDNVTDFSYMFYGAKFTNEKNTDSFQYPIKTFNTNNGIDFSYMFSEMVDGDKYNNNDWMDIDTSNAATVKGMFCNNRMVTNISDMDFSKATDASYFCQWATGIIHIGTLRSGSVKNWSYSFQYTNSITEINGIDLSSATNVYAMFAGCYFLRKLIINGTISVNNLDLTSCTSLTHDSLMSVIRALVDKTSDTSGTVWTIKLGSTNLAKLTNNEKLIMENKGWAYA